MNTVLTEKMDKVAGIVTRCALKIAKEEFEESRIIAEAWERKWGKLPEQEATQILDSAVQERIEALIHGTEVDGATEFELTVAGDQLDKVVGMIVNALMN